jgi:hypothetical protein
VLIPIEVGYALQAGSYLTNRLSALPKRPDRFPLSYCHDTQHFVLGNRLLSDVWLLLISYSSELHVRQVGKTYELPIFVRSMAARH